MVEWSKEEIFESIEKRSDFFLYLYTPMCGTCQLAGRMIEIVSSMFPNKTWGKCDLNFIPEYAEKWEIESVPCLLIFQEGEIVKKIYAFHSVPYLYETVNRS